MATTVADRTSVEGKSRIGRPETPIAVNAEAVMNAQAFLSESQAFHARQARLLRAAAAEHERMAQQESFVSSALRDAIADTERQPRRRNVA